MAEKLTKSGLLILSFGYVRNFENNPWFRSRDLIDSFPDGPLKRLATSRGNFSKLTRKYIELNLLEGRGRNADENMRGTKSDSSTVRITDNGTDELITNLAQVITTSSITLVDLLPIPNLPEVILETSDLANRIIIASCGFEISNPNS